MMELLHIHFSFLCRSGRSNNKGQSPIVLRIIYRQERRDIYTGLYCKTEDWDTTNGKVFSHCKQAATLNKNLELINYKAMQVFDELKFSSVPFTIDELTGKIKGKEDRPLLLIEFFSSYWCWHHLRCNSISKKERKQSRQVIHFIIILVFKQLNNNLVIKTRRDKIEI